MPQKRRPTFLVYALSLRAALGGVRVQQHAALMPAEAHTSQN